MRESPSRAQWLRRLASRRRDRVAFVFSGGGPLGALQVGAVRALFEHGVVPELAIGTSVGALNAAFLAFEPTLQGVVRLEDHWRNFHDGDLLPGGRLKAAPWARMLRRGSSVFENSGLRGTIERGLGSDARFEQAQIPLAVVATDLETGEEKVFSSGRLMDPLLASSAMPGVFAPVEISGRRYIDGGVANQVPIAPAVALGGKTVYVLDASSHAHQRRPLVRPVDYLLHAFTLARSQRLIVEQPFYAERVRLVVLPSPPLDFYVPFGSMVFTDRLIKLSYESTKAFLDGGSESLIESAGPGDMEALLPGK